MITPSRWLPGLAQHGLPDDFDLSVVRTAGDARKLIGALPNRDRGKAARALYEHRAVIDKAVVYSGMMAAWDHDHGVTDRAFPYEKKGGLSFAKALRDVAPAHHLFKPIPVWRGVCLTVEDGASWGWGGFSWTRDRNLACWFAFRFQGVQEWCRPLVYRLDAKPEEVVTLHHARGEREVILDPYELQEWTIRIDSTRIDCEDIDDDYAAPPNLTERWRRASNRHAAAKKKRESNG